jgi:hypothetical protein
LKSIKRRVVASYELRATSDEQLPRRSAQAGSVLPSSDYVQGEPPDFGSAIAGHRFRGNCNEPKAHVEVVVGGFVAPLRKRVYVEIEQTQRFQIPDTGLLFGLAPGCLLEIGIIVFDVSAGL